jgi:hypothetical protein
MLTLLGAVVSLVLAIIILSKVNKKGWCGEGFAMKAKPKGMVLKATSSCQDYITIDPYGNQTQFPCGNWVSQAKSSKKCMTDTMGDVNCYGSGDWYGPMDCCNAICDTNNLSPGDMCTDPSP